MKAPRKLKSRIYSALVQAQAAEGGLLPLCESKAAGGGLCVFEEAVALLPSTHAAQTRNPCRVCHARVLAERLENPPIWWPNCPYAQFKKPD
jgi:hypothetical protein